MNTRAFMMRRDMAAACALVIAITGLLFGWKPSLQPGSATAHLTPPIITYTPNFMTAVDHRESDGEYPDAGVRYDRDPSLIALSAAMMLPADKRGQTEAVTPPLDVAARFLRFPDTPRTTPTDRIPMLTPPRPMTLPASSRLDFPSRPARPSATSPSYRIDLAGNWQGRSVDLAPLLTIDSPTRPWSFTVVLQYDAAGRIQHVLLESTEIEPSLRNEVTRRLYQCRVTPGKTPGEGRLTVYGPGKK